MVEQPVVSLREITDDNRAAVEALSVTEDQDTYVAGVASSLREAVEYPEACAWYRAVYADEEPVGFVMISDNVTDDDPTLVGPYFLWRLLVDQRFQGRGYGSAALDLVVDYVRTRPDARALLTSHVVGPTSPEPFYLRYGFRPTGEVHGGEPVLALDLFPS
jgi:diamine N-acetyltransferase